jgi:hypothetical protein
MLHLVGTFEYQCALNMEEYDIAKQLRNKLSEVRLVGH